MLDLTAEQIPGRPCMRQRTQADGPRPNHAPVRLPQSGFEAESMGDGEAGAPTDRVERESIREPIRSSGGLCFRGGRLGRG